MRATLVATFLGILLVMLVVTVWASCDRAVWKAGYLFREPWFVATCTDAYCGFLTFYVWVAYKERGIVPRIAWFLAIMGLGNIAIAVYMLLQLVRLPRHESWERLLLRPSPNSPYEDEEELR